MAKLTLNNYREKKKVKRKGVHAKNKTYKSNEIKERHRHRYEFNNSFKKEFNDNGMVTSGVNKKLNLVEVIELKNHPWFIGTQYHPEYRSRVLKPHPLFISFVKKIKSIKNGQ